MNDLISRQAAINGIREIASCCDVGHEPEDYVYMLQNLPSAQPESAELNEESKQNVPNDDLISRKMAIEKFWHSDVEFRPTQIDEVMAILKELPSAQPERTCVNCGRTANNGGWYADGGTRCPIEEHYALPKDGYCHLWEKRNVTDDDYPEGRADE